MTEQIIKQLIANNQTITFAESCTGGLISSAFTSVPGASNVLNGSLITYSNQIKHAWLGVKNHTLQKFGAVSKQCVREMSQGALIKANADYAIAISGIAGPSGGSGLKPVGTVYIGISSKDQTITYKHLFQGNRTSIQKQATAIAIELFFTFLRNTQKTLDN